MMNQIPTNMQITGMMLGMTGTIIVSVGDTIVKLGLRCWREMKGKHHEESFEDDSDRGEYKEMKGH